MPGHVYSTFGHALLAATVILIISELFSYISRGFIFTSASLSLLKLLELYYCTIITGGGGGGGGGCPLGASSHAYRKKLNRHGGFLDNKYVFLYISVFTLEFLVLLSSSNGNVFIPGRDPVLNCASIPGTITSVEWLINGTRLEDLSLTNVETGFIGQGVLVFNNISVEYNNTNIQCRDNLSNGETEDSNNFTLLVQGEMEQLVNWWK